MFDFTPSLAWQTQGSPSATLVAVKEKADKKNVGLFGYLLGRFSRARRQISPPRREPTVFGLRAMTPPGPQAPTFMRPVGGLTTEAWMTRYAQDRQLEALTQNAENMITDLTHVDNDMMAIEAQAQTRWVSPELANTAAQTFARIDQSYYRWNLQAEELERQAANPLAQATARPKKISAYTTSRQQRPPFLAQGRMLLAPSSGQRSPTPKANGMRYQINYLAARPLAAGETRQKMQNRLAGLHNTIDHLSHDLHQHRDQIESHIHERKDRRRGPRQPHPAPVYKPKTKGDGEV